MSEAADRRVSELLRDLEHNAREAPPDLSRSVLRTARWQHAARSTLVISSELAGVVSTALRLAAGSRKP